MTNKIWHKLLMALLLTGTSLGLTACFDDEPDTPGEALEQLGDDIEDATDDIKDATEN